MKSRILSLIGLVLSLVGASAQNHNSFSVLAVPALQTGTNGWGVTNLSLIPTNSGMIYNPTNTTYTNSDGSYVGTSTSYLASIGTTNANTTKTLFRDIPLFADRNGVPIQFPIWGTGAAGLETNYTWFSPQTLFIQYYNPRGSNAPFGITFRPIWDGVTAHTDSGQDWGVNIAGLATTQGSLSTNIPTWRWPGAKALRVVQVTNLYVLGGVAAQTNSTVITKLNVNGFVP